MSSSSPLPDYDRPPVIEVVCGVQFEALPGFHATAFGLLWQRFRGDYPTCEQKPPLSQVFERFGEAVEGETRVEVSNVLPLPRMFFVNQSPCWLLQVQADRFLHNWRMEQETDAYPRFSKVFEKFWSAWERFGEFCQEEKIGTPQVNQLEITYINHIVQGKGWGGIETIGQVFPDIGWRVQRSFLPPPESVAWKASFAMPGNVGRLHASVRPAIRRRDDIAVLLCELTVRGVPSSTGNSAIREWFSLSREWIVRGFADLTHEQVQEKIWKRKKV